MNETYTVGNVDQKGKDLIKAAHDSMMAAIALVKPGCPIREFGNAITAHCRPLGFGVVRSFCGHGIGDLFHCAPNVPHYANNKAIGTCKAGMVLTIEPMINEGGWEVKIWPDDWTAVTADGKRSAQFEHMIVVTEDGYELLSARLPTSRPLWWEEEAAKEVAAAPAEKPAETTA
jgi:methionyl aminopeptidase